MSSTPVFAATTTAVRRFVLVLLSATAVLFVAGTAMAAVDGPRPGVAQVFDAEVWDLDDLPDVAIVIAGVDPGDARISEAAVPALTQLSGVADVETRLATSGRVAVAVSLTDDAAGGTIDRVERTVRAVLPEAAVSVGGRIPTDRALLDGINRGLLVGITPVIVLVAVLVASAFGIRVGLAIGLNVALSTVLGGLIGARLAGSFDGTLGSTATPAVLVALLVSTVFAFRLLDWFRSGPPADPALAIEGAVRHLVPEVALLFGGVVVSALALELIDPGRTPASVVAAGGIAATLVTLGALPAVLSSMSDLEPRDEYRLLGSFVPDGRDVPVAALAGFTCFLLGLGLFSLRAPTTGLLDSDDLASGQGPARVAAQLAEAGGDASDGIVATFPLATPDTAVVTWTEIAAAVDGVASVAQVGPDATGAVHAVVALSVPGRSPDAQAVVGTLATLTEAGATVTPTLAGVPVEAAATSDAAGTVLWPLVILLAVTGGVAVQLLLGDPVLALFAAILRLVGTAALLGVYHLVASEVTGTELQVAALVLGVGVGLFEIGFLRRIRSDLDRSETAPASEAREDIVSEAFRVEGRAAMIGLGVAALGGIGLLAGELDAARRLGVAISTGLVLELFIGTWLLRPAVLGERVVLLGAARRDASVGDAETVESSAVELTPAAPSIPVPSAIPAAAEVVFDADRTTDRDVEIDVDLDTDIELEPAAFGEMVELDPATLDEFDDAGLHTDRLPDRDLISAETVFPEPVVIPERRDDTNWFTVEELFGELENLTVQDLSNQPSNPTAQGAPMTAPAEFSGRTEARGADDLAFGSGAAHPLRRSTDHDPADAAETAAAARAASNPAAETGTVLGAADRLRRRADRMLRRRRSDGPAPRPVLDLDVVDATTRPVEPEVPAAATPAVDPTWGRVVSGLLRAEFDFQTRPDDADLETVFVEGTPLFGELREHNLRLRTSGLWVRGAYPRLEKLTVVNEGSPATVAVTVLHPVRQLLDRDGRELGVRSAERREGLLWLVQDPSGRYRIAEAVDLGVVTPMEPLDGAAPAEAATPVEADAQSESGRR